MSADKVFVKCGLTHREAAEHVGVPINTFLKLVSEGHMPKPIEGHMPKPIKVGNRTIFVRFAIDEAFDDLSSSEETEIEKWRKSY